MIEPVESERERRRRLKEATDHIAATRPGFSASDNLSREELHDRAAARSAAEDAKRERRRRLMDKVIADITANGGGLRMENNLSREELYDRDAARTAAEEAKRQQSRGT